LQERKVKPHRAHDSTRLVMVILGRMFSWRGALVNIKPDTFIRWHRKGFRFLWRWKSRPVGRPRTPQDLRRLPRNSWLCCGGLDKFQAKLCSLSL